jgi:hypothetical protein
LKAQKTMLSALKTKMNQNKVIMKPLRITKQILFASMFASAMLFSCEENDDVSSQKDILPKTFSVEIPSALSDDASVGGRRRTSGRMQEDSVNGNELYQHLRTFIAVGQASSQLVEEFINGIRIHKIDRVMSLTYKGDDDNRVKNLVVTSNSSFEGKTWDYQLTVTDADSESNADGGKALQIFWNDKTPISGIAIIKPYNCDRLKNQGAPDAVFRINYSETSASGYEAEMEVLISGLPLASPLQDPYSMSTLRMFAGKKGDVVDVFGNSNHPNAILFTDEAGFNWAFVASGNEIKDIGVAEVGLPPSNLNDDDRNVLLKQYSVKNVLTKEITAIWPGIDQNLLSLYLTNTAAPAYFNNNGFIKGGTSPGADWDALATRLTNLKPFNPKEVSNLKVAFK